MSDKILPHPIYICLNLETKTLSDSTKYSLETLGVEDIEEGSEYQAFGGWTWSRCYCA